MNELDDVNTARDQYCQSTFDQELRYVTGQASYKHISKMLSTTKEDPDKMDDCIYSRENICSFHLLENAIVIAMMRSQVDPFYQISSFLIIFHDRVWLQAKGCRASK